MLQYPLRFTNNTATMRHNGLKKANQTINTIKGEL